MERIKCITFDKAAQDAIPKEIKEKMKSDRAKAEKEQETKAKTLAIHSVVKAKRTFYCQREIEFESKCEEQCDHCKSYYSPLERQ